MTAILFLCTAAAFAQPARAGQEILSHIILTGESGRTGRRLAAADELASAGKWSPAVEEYQRILAESGDDLVALDNRHYLRSRYLCHLRLAAAPASALRLYRARVDGHAKKWLDQAT